MSIIFAESFDLDALLGKGQVNVGLDQLKVKASVFVAHNSSGTRISIDTTQVGHYVGTVARDLIHYVINERMRCFGCPTLLLANRRCEAVSSMGFIDENPQLVAIPRFDNKNPTVSYFVVQFKWDGRYHLSIAVNTVGELI